MPIIALNFIHSSIRNLQHQYKTRMFLHYWNNCCLQLFVLRPSKDTRMLFRMQWTRKGWTRDIFFSANWNLELIIIRAFNLNVISSNLKSIRNANDMIWNHFLPFLFACFRFKVEFLQIIISQHITCNKKKLKEVTKMFHSSRFKIATY